ncbi:unnamed protein product [Somion occarium]|uniref:Uncharacterized protein n=1 Tax=Somion occarium TaxID=3059160 RepID=A0ABP1CT00_9APHY
MAAIFSSTNAPLPHHFHRLPQQFNYPANPQPSKVIPFHPVGGNPAVGVRVSPSIDTVSIDNPDGALGLDLKPKYTLRVNWLGCGPAFDVHFSLKKGTRKELLCKTSDALQQWIGKALKERQGAVPPQYKLALVENLVHIASAYIYQGTIVHLEIIIGPV